MFCFCRPNKGKLDFLCLEMTTNPIHNRYLNKLKKIYDYITIMLPECLQDEKTSKDKDEERNGGIPPVSQNV